MSSILNRRQVVGGLTAGVTTLSTSACASRTGSGLFGSPQDRNKPNIVFILADDLGYADLSCYGRRDYETPNIDKLARDGLMFTSGYSNSPVCSATRTGLITGRYQYRFPVGLEEPVGFSHIGLAPETTTLPSELKRAGYQTSLVGKWHLGRLPDYGPLKSGYDHFYGVREGGVDYYRHSNDLWDGDVKVEEVGYITNLLGDRAVQQIREFSKSDTPFFMSLHFTAPHWPWEGDNAEGQSESERLANQDGMLSILHYDGGSLKTYADMVKRMDDQVGRVVAALKQSGVDKNTIVVFTSDNGGERFSDNWPFSGQKAELLEGGIRVPLIVKWPGHVRHGSKTDTPAISMDWVPTLLVAAGMSGSGASGYDGVNLLEVLNGGTIPERALFWRYNLRDQQAVRFGQWKYLKIGENEFLFDVIQDPRERGNRKLREPEIFADLKSRYASWNAEMLPYGPENFSSGYSARTTPDRYGNERSTTAW